MERNFILQEVLRVGTNVSSSGDNIVIAAPGAGKRIAVLGYVIQAHGTVSAYFTDGAAGTRLGLTWSLQAREGASVPLSPQPWWIGTANTALILNLNGAVECGVEVTYLLVG